MTCSTLSPVRLRTHRRYASMLWWLLAGSTILGILTSCGGPKVPQSEISQVVQGFTVLKDDPNGSPSDLYEYRTLFVEPTASTIEPLQLLHENIVAAGWKLVESSGGGETAEKGGYHLRISTAKQYANLNPSTRGSSPPTTTTEPGCTAEYLIKLS